MSDDAERDDPDRDAILRRRNRLVAVALSGVAAASLGACEPQPCLRPAVRDSGVDASPVPCLEPSVRDAGSTDAGNDAGRARTDAGEPPVDAGDPPDDAGARDAGTDGGPLPCLAPMP